MKKKYFFLTFFTKLFIVNLYDNIYNPSEVIEYINGIQPFDKDNCVLIIEKLKAIFNDAYAFNEISAKPPQPTFQENYHDKIDIITSLNEIMQKINDGEITETYDFYRKVTGVFSNLKDAHIKISWESMKFQEFNIIAPIQFIIKEINNTAQIFVECPDEEFPEDDDIKDKCLQDKHDPDPVISINEKNPFDFINDFGGNFVSTKNMHSTFSFKLNYHNDVPLNDYPLSLEELSKLNIVFNSRYIINTTYYLASDYTIENRLRNLNKKNNINENKQNKINKRKRKRNGKRNLSSDILWNYQTYGDDEDILKCYEDKDNNVNIYYISSFAPNNKDNFIRVVINCCELFDKNDYPIIVINEYNDGGYVSLSQFFLGIISPLMSINLYKGRMRITDTFKDTPEIRNYIETNLTSSENCLHTNYERLTSDKIHVKYDEDIEIDLTQMFFLTNIDLHNEIENIRKKMINKRKPTDILVFTDGFSFSAASLFMQYLQKNGGAIIASYLGNPNHKDKIFDISQSPSPLFTSNLLLKVFSPVNYGNLEEEWSIEFPGIQSFYDSDDFNNPLEYEVISPDITTDIYVSFEENHKKFIDKSKEIFDKFKEECYSNNKNLIKISENCENTFGNTYTHGGYECGDKGIWNTDNCVASYCDPGYYFNKKKKKCVKDICSSIPVKEDNNLSSFGQFTYNNFFFLFFFLIINYL